MIRPYLLFIFSFIVMACTKEVIIYDAEVNDNFELPLILSFNGKNCAYDHNTKTLKYTVHPDSLDNYAPFVEFQDYSAVKFDQKTLSNYTVNSLGNIQLYKAYPVEITVKGHQEFFSLIFTDIPIVQIITKGKIVNTPKISGRMLMSAPTENVGLTESWVGVETRGSSSLNKDKKSYGVALYQSKALKHIVSKAFFGMKNNHKWILDAMYIDVSRVRNKSSFDIWKRIDANYIGIKSKYVEVFVNSKSMGLYAFNESYTPEYLNLSNGSVLYEGIDNSEETFFNRFSDDKPNSAIWEEWEQKYPNPEEKLIWDDFQELCKLVAEGSDEEFIHTISQQVNIDLLIDYYLFINLCQGYDNVGKNCFFLKRGPGAKFEIIPWDLDATWGRDAKSNLTKNHTQVSNNLFRRLINLNPNNYIERLTNRWVELRGNVFSESELLEVFDQNFTRIKNYQIIPFENQIWQQGLNLSAEQAYLHQWLHERLIFLDNYFSGIG